MSEYMLRITDPSGVDIGDLSTRSFISLVYTRKLNSIGALTLKFPYSQKLFRMFKAETIIGVYRKLPGVGYTIDGNTRWFVRKINDNREANGARYLEVEAYDAMTLLERRYIAYNLGNEYTTKVDYADDMAKVIMNENFGALALEPERNISDYLEVDKELSLASAIYKEFQRETLLSSLQSLADASDENGTPLYFDIIYVPETKTFIFKTYVYQRGIDLTTDNYGLKSVILGEERNNLSGVTAEYDYSNEANYVYVGGSGVGDIAAIASVYNAQRIAISPFGRIETYKSGVSTASADELYDEARAELIDKTPKVTIEGKVRDIEGTKYGIHYYLGDRVTVVHNGNYFDTYIEAVTTTVTESGETVDVTLKSIEEVISATGNIIPPSPPPLPPNPTPTPPSPTPPGPPPSELIWTERQPAGDVNKNWYGIDSDDDGSNLIVCVGGGRLYTSSDSGANWTERQPAGNTDINWVTVASDSDGTNLIACVQNDSITGFIYTSSNSGANWATRKPAGDVSQLWSGVASDDDGSNLIACVYYGRLWTSSDGGSNWTERRPSGDVDKYWYCVGSDADGSNLIAGCAPGRLYTSSDSGASWTERQPAGSSDYAWVRVSSNSDGSVLIAAQYSTGKRLYTSSDGGASWTERQPGGNANYPWHGVSVSSDGTVMIACVFNGRLYISRDGGLTWSEVYPPGGTPANYYWYNSVVSGDGSKFMAGGLYSMGRLYTGVQS